MLKCRVYRYNYVYDKPLNSMYKCIDFSFQTAIKEAVVWHRRDATRRIIWLQRAVNETVYGLFWPDSHHNCLNGIPIRFSFIIRQYSRPARCAIHLATLEIWRAQCWVWKLICSSCGQVWKGQAGGVLPGPNWCPPGHCVSCRASGPGGSIMSDNCRLHSFAKWTPSARASSTA